MDIKTIGGALAGGTVGTIGWCAFVMLGESEFRMMAWGVGALVAIGAALAGGRGKTLGAVCALVAMGSILTAKAVIAADRASKTQADAATLSFSPEDHAQYMQDASTWVSKRPLNIAFMTSHRRYKWDTKPGFSRLDFEVFDDFWAPRLNAWGTQPPPYETWKPQFEADLRILLAERAGFFGQLKGATSPFDLLFIFVGIATAFGLIAGRGEPPTTRTASDSLTIDYSPPAPRSRPTRTTTRAQGIDAGDQPPGMRE